METHHGLFGVYHCIVVEKNGKLVNIKPPQRLFSFLFGPSSISARSLPKYLVGLFVNSGRQKIKRRWRSN